jgi:hypothetical protein
MTGTDSAGPRLLGRLRVADGRGVMRVEHRVDTGIDEVWSALTDPSRLAGWYGEVAGGGRSGDRAA